MKRCTICGIDQPLMDFRRRSDSADGHRADCRTCCIARDRARYTTDKEHMLAWQRAWYRENRDAKLAYLRGYRPSRRAHAATISKTWRDSDLARARASERASRYRHWASFQNVRRRAQTAYRARLRGARVERVDFQVIWERDGGMCGICGLVVDLSDRHFDHIVPLARGGAHATWNIQVAHALCNRRKGAR